MPRRRVRRHDGAPGRLETAAARRIRLARLALFWDRLWPAIWPATGVAGLFIALSLMDLWAVMPGWLHAFLLAFFAGTVLVLAWRGIAGLAMPGAREAERRIERASGLAHRPLGALRDRPADTEDGTARALWRAHLERTARAARALRIGMPSPGLARRDPLGLRAVVALLLVIGFVAAGDKAPGHLLGALQPDFSASAAIPVNLTLWITPPAYTGSAPVFLAAGAASETASPGIAVAGDVVVPVGSVVLARLHGGRGTPSLVIDGQTAAFARIDAENYELRAEIETGGRLAVVQGGEEVGAWPLTVIADQPPEIAFAKPPGRTLRAALRLDYIAEDDYSVASVRAIIARIDGRGEPITLDLAVARSSARVAEGTSFHDLTPHPWAGLPVRITLHATDAIGQTGSSDPVDTVLPERIFNHPVARALVEQRKALSVDPTARAEVVRALDEIASWPDRFGDDLSVFLALRAVRWRLAYDTSDEAIPEIQDFLWDLALTIEEGPVALAEQALREAQQALMDALDEGAGDDEIERLFEELLAKLDEFLDALVEDVEQRRDMESSLEEEMREAIERSELRQLVEQMRELYRTGARDAAREMLAQLQELLENLRAGRFAGEDPEGSSEARAALEQLQGLIGDQQELLDQTFRWAQGMGEEGEGGERGPQDFGMLQQEALRQRLGELMRKWGETGQEIPRPLGRAEHAMRDAARALMDNRPGQAVGPETRAIDQLQQGAEAMMEALEQMGGRPQRSGGMSGMFGERDPLGRGTMGRGFEDDGRTHVPDELELQRSREILEELYRRAGDRKRPSVEREYIRRLLQRF